MCAMPSRPATVGISGPLHPALARLYGLSLAFAIAAITAFPLGAPALQVVLSTVAGLLLTGGVIATLLRACTIR